MSYIKKIEVLSAGFGDFVNSPGDVEEYLEQYCKKPTKKLGRIIVDIIGKQNEKGKMQDWFKKRKISTSDLLAGKPVKPKY